MSMLPRVLFFLVAWAMAATMVGHAAAQGNTDAAEIQQGAEDQLDAVDRLIAPNRIVILDYSGSMVIPGATRDQQIFPAALEAAIGLARSASTVSPEARSGLIVFGHRLGVANRNGLTVEQSCQDYKFEVHYSLADKAQSDRIDEAARQLRGLSPGGETPLSQTIALAADRMKDGGAIILLTDLDKSTCDRTDDPCAEIEELRQRYAEREIFLTHVVAVPARDKSASGPRRLAECTGAKALVLDNSPETVVSQINRDLRAATQLAQVRVRAVVEPDPVILPLDDAALASLTVSDSARSGGIELSTQYRNIEVMPGPVSVAGRIGEETVQRSLSKVTRRHVEEVDLKFEPYLVEIVLRGPEGQALPKDTAVEWRVEAAGRETSILGGPTVELAMLAFPHVVTARLPGFEGVVNVTPEKPGERRVIEIAAHPTGDSVSTSVATDVRSPREALFGDLGAYRIVLRGAGPETAMKPREIRSDIAEGEYEVFLAFEGLQILLGRLPIEAGRTVRVEGTTGSGLLLARTDPPADEDTVWTVTSAIGGVKEFSGPELRQVVIPGQYTVSARNGNGTGSVAVSVFPDRPVRELNIRLQ